MSDALQLLDEVLNVPVVKATSDGQVFQDSDGLISFANLSSTFVQDTPEFKAGRELCDKISNFFATLRDKTFMFLQQHPDKVLPGDKKPETKWDQAVNHYMEHLLTLAGGLTNYKTTTETYSFTQTIGEFNTER